MKDPLKPRDKITQKMTRDGAITENQTTGETERISKRTQDAELQKTPEQQAAQDAAQLNSVSDTIPLPHVPGAAPKADTGKTERVMEHIEAAHTRKASKKAVRKAQAEATAGTKSSRLQFTDEERAAPELEKYIKKSDKAADRLDKAKAAIPKEKKLVKERAFDEATGKGKTRLHFEEQDKPPGFKESYIFLVTSDCPEILSRSGWHFSLNNSVSGYTKIAPFASASFFASCTDSANASNS